MHKSYQAYQKNQVTTVSSERLLLMLYDGLVRFIRNAYDALGEGKIAEVSNNLIKAQAIIGELMVSLDRNAGDFADSLFSIYDFMNRSLVEANIKKDMDQIGNVLEVALDLQEMWNEAVRALSTERDGAARIAR